MTNNGYCKFKSKYNWVDLCCFVQDSCEFFDLFDFVEAMSSITGQDRYELVRTMITLYGCTYVSKRPYISFNQVNKFIVDTGLSGICDAVECNYGGVCDGV